MSEPENAPTGADEIRDWRREPGGEDAFSAAVESSDDEGSTVGAEPHRTPPGGTVRLVGQRPKMPGRITDQFTRNDRTITPFVHQEEMLSWTVTP